MKLKIKTKKRKMKSILISSILLGLIICSLNSKVSAASEPKITNIDYPILVTKGEDIRITVTFSYDWYPKLGVTPEGDITGIYLYYNINSRVKYDTFLLYRTGPAPLEWRPDKLIYTILTNNFQNGDYVKFRIYFDYAGVGGVYQGTVESAEHRIDYRESDENYDLVIFWLQYKWVIISVSILIVLILLYFVRRRRSV